MSRKITALRVQQRNKERVSVFLDDEYAFSLTLMEAASLRKGQTLSEQDIAQLKAVDERHQALDKALRFLATRPRSQAEIRQNLRRAQYDEIIIDETLTRLEDMGYVSDADFADFWVRNREAFQPRAPRALRAELREKGVPREIIDSALADVDPVESARRAAAKKIRSLRGSSRQQFKQKLGGFLARRGFGYETINTVLSQLIEEISDPENMEAPYFAEDLLHDDNEE